MSQREDLIDTDKAKVASIALDIGEKSPWHYHSKVLENVICLKGEIELQLKSPKETILLRVGERYSIDQEVKHRLVNRGNIEATYLLIQRGEYDFIQES